MARNLFFTAALSLSMFLCSTAVLIDTMKHDIFVVTAKNFDSQINSFRKNGVAVVAFYRNNPRNRKFINNDFNEFAKEIRGMVKVAGLDCDAWADFCNKEEIGEFPHVKVYPPMPYAPFDLKPEEGEEVPTSKKLLSVSRRQIPSTHIRILKKEDKPAVDAFLATQVAVPKVVLFSSKPKPPVLLSALSNAFHDRMSFGFVSDTEDSILTRFNVKTVPSLMIIKGEITPGKSGEFYTGELNYHDLHEWLNVRSETFVKGGGYQSDESAENVKPWLVQKVPEMTRASHQDVCFRHKTLCLIYVGKPTESDMGMLEERHDHYAAVGSDRGAQFRFSWIDPSVETAFAELVGLTSTEESLVIFNPHKRLRFMKNSTTSHHPTASDIDALIERVLGGDARFTNVKGQKLPPFADREKDKNEAKMDEL